MSCAAAESVPRDGVPMRFCQQCGRFQELSAFEGTMRTCRVRLDKHAARRRRSGALGAKRLREQERRAEAGEAAFQVPAARPQAHPFAPERLAMRDDGHHGAAGRSFSSSQLAALWGGQDLAATPARVADLHGRDSQAEVASLLASLIDQRHRGGDGMASAPPRGPPPHAAAANTLDPAVAEVGLGETLIEGLAQFVYFYFSVLRACCIHSHLHSIQSTHRSRWRCCFRTTPAASRRPT